ncbi:hypothetical protein DFH09DRAFT_1098406 [Mycena vulgaris]|nr:hypothetical protein DFH09DRAFT_1098406 [Mycena vulgaris]
MVGDAFVDEREVREAREKREAGPRGPPLIAARVWLKSVRVNPLKRFVALTRRRWRGSTARRERTASRESTRKGSATSTVPVHAARSLIALRTGKSPKLSWKQRWWTWLWKNAGGRDWIAVWKDTAMCIGGGRQIQRRLLIQLAPFHPNRLCDPLVARRQILKLGLPKINWTLAPGLDRRCYEITAAMTPIGLYPRAPWSSELLLQSCVW